MRTLFEQTFFLLCEAVVCRLKAKKGIHTENLCPNNVAPLSLLPPGQIKKGGPGPGTFLGYGLIGLAMAGALGRRLSRRPAVARAAR